MVMPPRFYRLSGRIAIAAISVVGAGPDLAQHPAALSVAGGSEIFREAQQICRRDSGKLWGRSLCGPIMLVDPTDRRIVANRSDARGILRRNHSVFTGKLPQSENIANTALPWSGTYWTQISWPLPADPLQRQILIAHELFHRIAPKLDLPLIPGGDNHHLDSLEGRYLLQLEWRALSAALNAGDEAARRRAIRDALLFRSERYRIFPAAQSSEQALELNEGLAEYTGLSAGLADPALRTKAATGEFTAHQSDPSFVRSFAYATGPAYGLLLDRYSGTWRSRLAAQPRLDLLLADAAGIEIPRDLPSASTERALAYDGPALREAETRRNLARLEALAGYRKRFIDGPTVLAPLSHLKIQFDPRNLQPLDELGTVYPSLRIADDWGVLEAENGALVGSKWDKVTLAGPATLSGNRLSGDGWTIDLKPGWRPAGAMRPGDVVLAGPVQ